MLKKTITYTDYNNVVRTEDFYFNLTKAEIMEMELSTTGGFAEMMSRVIAAQDAPTIIKTFKEVILKAYGQKSPDGRRFIKSQEIVDDFAQTEAFSQLYVELSTDDEAASKFITGVVPAEMAKEVEKAKAEGKLDAMLPGANQN